MYLAFQLSVNANEGMSKYTLVGLNWPKALCGAGLKGRADKNP